MKNIIPAVILLFLVFSCSNPIKQDFDKNNNDTDSVQEECRKDFIDSNFYSSETLCFYYELVIESYFIRSNYYIKDTNNNSANDITSGTIIQLDGTPRIVSGKLQDSVLPSRVFIEFTDQFYHDTLMHTESKHFCIFMNYKEMPAVLETLNSGKDKPFIYIKKFKSGKVMAQLYRKYTIKTKGNFYK